MKVSGFTIVRNGVAFDYPFVESLRSLAPLVDELVVNVGDCDDGTLEAVEAVRTEFPSVQWVVFRSVWPLNDPEKKRSGLILSEQTNLALAQCTGDWCIYLQADEVFHEEDRAKIIETLKSIDQDKRVEGIVLNYRHLYGSFDVEQYSRSAYRREVRIVRNQIGIKSVGDAQSFRAADGSKPRVVLSCARVFHYGWVRDPKAMKDKTFFLDQLYHGSASESELEVGIPKTKDNYRYKRFVGLRLFKETHPQVMSERISKKNWTWDFKNSSLELHWSDAKKLVLDSLESLTGIRFFEYKSYRFL